MAISQINSNSLASGVPASANMPVGSVLQMVNAYTSTSVSVSANTNTDTTLTATITPKSATSKIVVLVFHGGVQKGPTNSTYMTMGLFRNASSLITWEFQLMYNAQAQYLNSGYSNSWVDSPATTSATTYKTTIRSTNGQSYVGVQLNGETSTMVLLEIAA